MTSIPWDELMDAAGDSDLAPIPQGDYDVKIVSSEATKSSTDKPMWKITVEVEGGPHAGKKAWTQQTLTMDNANALQIFFRQMAAAGLTQDFFKTKPTPQQIADALMGRRFRAKMIIEEYQGVPRNKIKQWNPPSMAAGSPPPPSGASRTVTVPPPGSGGPPPGTPGGPPPASSAPRATTPPPAPPSASPPPAPAPSPAPTPNPEPVTETAPPGTSEEPQTLVGSGTPAGGDASAWVVEERKTGATEPPPF